MIEQIILSFVNGVLSSLTLLCLSVLLVGLDAPKSFMNVYFSVWLVFGLLSTGYCYIKDFRVAWGITIGVVIGILGGIVIYLK